VLCERMGHCRGMMGVCVTICGEGGLREVAMLSIRIVLSETGMSGLMRGICYKAMVFGRGLR
jgi:hypothetical protein